MITNDLGLHLHRPPLKQRRARWKWLTWKAHLLNSTELLSFALNIVLPSDSSTVCRIREETRHRAHPINPVSCLPAHSEIEQDLSSCNWFPVATLEEGALPPRPLYDDEHWLTCSKDAEDFLWIQMNRYIVITPHLDKQLPIQHESFG